MSAPTFSERETRIRALLAVAMGEVERCLRHPPQVTGDGELASALMRLSGWQLHLMDHVTAKPAALRWARAVLHGFGEIKGDQT